MFPFEILLISLIVFASLIVYFLERNNKVHKLKLLMLDLSWLYTAKEIENNPLDYTCGIEFFYNKKPSYVKMLFSFHPLNIKRFITDEEDKEFRKILGDDYLDKTYKYNKKRNQK